MKPSPAKLFQEFKDEPEELKQQPTSLDAAFKVKSSVATIRRSSVVASSPHEKSKAAAEFDALSKKTGLSKTKLLIANLLPGDQTNRETQARHHALDNLAGRKLRLRQSAVLFAVPRADAEVAATRTAQGQASGQGLGRGLSPREAQVIGREAHVKHDLRILEDQRVEQYGGTPAVQQSRPAQSTGHGIELRDGLYTVSQRSNGRLLDGFESGTKSVVTNHAERNKSQRWCLERTVDGGDVFTLQLALNYKFLEAYSAKEKDFACLTTKKCRKMAHWRFTPVMLKGVPLADTYRVEQVETGRFLDAHEGADAQDFDEEGGPGLDAFGVMTRVLQKNTSQHWVFEVDEKSASQAMGGSNQRAAHAAVAGKHGGRAGAGAIAGLFFGMCLRMCALCGVKCHDDDTVHGQWDCDEKVAVIYGPFFELYSYTYRFFSVWSVVRSIIFVGILAFMSNVPSAQLWSLIVLEFFSFGIVYIKKPHLDGTERIAALGGSLINLFFLICPMYFVSRGYEASDAAGMMISASMLMIAMEVYNQLTTTYDTLKGVVTLLCKKAEGEGDEVETVGSAMSNFFNLSSAVETNDEAPGGDTNADEGDLDEAGYEEDTSGADLDAPPPGDGGKRTAFFA